MNQEKIGKFLKELRIQNNLTQQELGDKLGISGKSISKWERGINLPDIAILKDISKIFHITTDELLNGERLNKEKNNNYFKKLLILTVTLIIILISFIIITNQNTYQIYQINSNNNKLDIDGYFIYNSHEEIFIINQLNYHEIINEESDYIILIILNNNEELINYKYNYQKDKVTNLINKTSLNIRKNKTKNIKDYLTLIIKFNNKEIEIPLRINEKLSNNLF